MSSYKALIIAAGTAVGLAIAISTFNIVVDPMCYYRCADVVLSRATSNSYYQAAQKIIAQPETEQILLGSSRAGTTSPIWLAQKTGLRTLNLEVPGAEVMTKIALMNLALERTKLRRVIWYADYFEIIPENIDQKLKATEALTKLLPPEVAASPNLARINPLITLLDHNTIAASINTLKVKPLALAREVGGNSGEYSACDSGNYQGKETAASLEKKVGLLYENYSQKILKPEPSESAWNTFVKSMAAVENRRIETVIVIIPYHPKFIARLSKEFPEIYKRHQDWVSRVNALASVHTKVLDYSSGIPGDDGSPKFWNDGVHFTCNGAITMLGSLRSPNN